MPDDSLERDLIDLGGALVVPSAPAGVDVAVLARLAAEPAPGRLRRLRSRILVRLSRIWRWLVGGLVVVLLSLGAVPPVRAQVSEWFSFIGVIVRVPQPGEPQPTGSPAPPAASADLTVEQAQALVTFRIVVPAALGTPDGVEVSDDRRLVSVSWQTPTGTVRLDQFDGRLDPVFAKAARDAVWVDVGDDFGLWFPTPHEVVVLDDPATDARRTLPPRLAAQTLVWQVDRTTLRLEGSFSQDQALSIARTAG